MEARTSFNIAYIDAANLDNALRLTLGWQLDYLRFRKWLLEKYDVRRANLFIGRIPRYEGRYRYLQQCGFTLVFKEVLYENGRPKGNCDADLIMQAANDLYEGDLRKAIIVASDGDYAPLVKTLCSKQKIETILSPAPKGKCSILLKRTNAPIAYLCDQRSLLEFTERRP